MHASRLPAALLALACTGAAAAAPEYAQVPAGTLSSVLAGDADRQALAVPAFHMRVLPVTVGEFARFVQAHPQWRRDRVARTFADADYLRSWAGPAEPGATAADAQPVTHVSWFAAQAFCEAEGARLPSWSEWEYVAAADATRPDARSDPVWLAAILGWYSRPAQVAPPPVGGPPNLYGVRDVQGLVWEWVDDFSALLVNGDSRSADDPDKAQFCGAGAINLQDRQNYAVLMRVALLSSLHASDSTGSLGFRCVRPTHQESP
jgi:formylglycine-generating enzyme required for sulfatase activity